MLADSFSVGGLIPYIFTEKVCVISSLIVIQRDTKFTIFPYCHQTSEPATVVIPPFISDYRLGHLVYITVGIEPRSVTLLVPMY